MERIKGYEGILIIVLLQIGLSHSSCGRAEYKRGGQCCPMCAAGNRVYKDCTEYASTSCIPCTHGTYLDEPNGLTTCFICARCDSGLGLRVKRPCTPTSDTVCEPMEGYYCLETWKGCSAATKHSGCKPGQYISQRGTEFADTVCTDCTGETFSDVTFTSCKTHRKCNSTEQAIHPGTFFSDIECGTQSSEGGTLALIISLIALFIMVAIVISLLWYYLRKHKKKSDSVDQTQTYYAGHRVVNNGQEATPFMVTPIQETNNWTEHEENGQSKDHSTSVPICGDVL